MNEVLDKVFLGNTVLDWLIAAGIVVGSFLCIAIIGPMIIKRLEKLAERTSTDYDDILILAIEKFIFPLLYVGSIYAALSYLTFPPQVDKYTHMALVLVYTYFIMRIITAIIEYLITSFLMKQEEGETKKKQARGLIIIIKFIVWALGFVFALDNMGFNVSTIIAGLGVGGIAIALAAQTVLGDLFAYFIIFFDRPFEIGDFIVFDADSGVVEYIGVKSTRVRTLNGQILVCSNKDLTNARVNNFKKMDRRRVVFKLGVIYQTPADKLEAIPGMVKEIILSVAGLEYDRGHMSGFGDSSLNFDFVYYVPSPDFTTYMDMQQEVNYKVFRKFEDEGIEFAYPTQTLFVQGNNEPTTELVSDK